MEKKTRPIGSANYSSKSKIQHVLPLSPSIHSQSLTDCLHQNQKNLIFTKKIGTGYQKPATPSNNPYYSTRNQRSYTESSTILDSFDKSNYAQENGLSSTKNRSKSKLPKANNIPKSNHENSGVRLSGIGKYVQKEVATPITSHLDLKQTLRDTTKRLNNRTKIQKENIENVLYPLTPKSLSNFESQAINSLKKQLAEAYRREQKYKQQIMALRDQNRKVVQEKREIIQKWQERERQYRLRVQRLQKVANPISCKECEQRKSSKSKAQRMPVLRQIVIDNNEEPIQTSHRMPFEYTQADPPVDFCSFQQQSQGNTPNFPPNSPRSKRKQMPQTNSLDIPVELDTFRKKDVPCTIQDHQSAQDSYKADLLLLQIQNCLDSLNRRKKNNHI